MNQNAAIWLLLILAFAAANLPFLNEGVFASIGAVGFTFERMIGNVFAQRWEFYATTFTLFVVMAFPGFVLRYLLRR